MVYPCERLTVVARCILKNNELFNFNCKVNETTNVVHGGFPLKCGRLNVLAPDVTCLKLPELGTNRVSNSKRQVNQKK